MGGALRYIIALLIAGFSLLTYWCKREENTVTGEIQHIDMTVDQEIALGFKQKFYISQSYTLET